MLVSRCVFQQSIHVTSTTVDVIRRAVTLQESSRVAALQGSRCPTTDERASAFVSTSSLISTISTSDYITVHQEFLT